MARPLSVLVSLTPFRVRLREQVFLSWAGLRGAVPVVLATVPVTKGAPNVDWIFDLVFVLVAIFTVIQAPSLPWVARRLGVAERHRTMDLDVEATPLEEMHADLLQVARGTDVASCTGWRSSSCGCPRAPTSPSSSGTGEGFVPDVTDRAAPRRPAPHRRDGGDEVGGGEAGAGDQPARSARDVADGARPASPEESG